MQAILDHAKSIIYQATTPKGILASSLHVDNYTRAWSRDAVMAGLAGLFIQDINIIDGFKNSILTLAEHQHANGVIPSNVSITDQNVKVSYGSLVGRTDATIWWIIGAISILRYDQDFLMAYGQKLKPKITKAFEVLNCWEYNNRGLIYSPLGGNWADEYVTSGYTLYDNVLYLWSLELGATFFKTDELALKASDLRQLIKTNFNNANYNPSSTYLHPLAAERRQKNLKPHFSASLSPNGFDQRWDMAGNALALYLNLYEDVDDLVTFITSLVSKYESGLIPVFYPIIDRQDSDWRLLEENYGYHFKNNPYQFHNGGFWPIFGGWLCMGLRKYNKTELANKISTTFFGHLEESNYAFFEYHDIRDGQGKGVQKLCFSAAGTIFMTLNN